MVGDIEVSVRVNGHPVGAEQRRQTRAALTVIRLVGREVGAPAALAKNHVSREIVRRECVVELQHPIVALIADEQVAARVECDTRFVREAVGSESSHIAGAVSAIGQMSAKIYASGTLTEHRISYAVGRRIRFAELQHPIVAVGDEDGIGTALGQGCDADRTKESLSIKSDVAGAIAGD